MLDREEFEAFHRGDWTAYEAAASGRRVRERRAARWQAVFGAAKDAAFIVVFALVVFVALAAFEDPLPDEVAKAPPRAHAELIDFCNKAADRDVPEVVGRQCEAVLSEQAEEAGREDDAAFAERLRGFEGMMERYRATRGAEPVGTASRGALPLRGI